MPSLTWACPTACGFAYLPVTTSSFQPAFGIGLTATMPSGMRTRIVVVAEPLQPCKTCRTALYCEPTGACSFSRVTCAKVAVQHASTLTAPRRLERYIDFLPIIPPHCQPSRPASAASPRLLDPGDDELSVHAIGRELDLVTGFDLLENRRVLHSKHHGVSFIHPEFLDRSMAEGNFLCGLIDFGDLPIDHLRLGKCRLRRPDKRESENTGCDQGRLTHDSSFPAPSAVT